MRIFYKCDRQKCKRCSFPLCQQTSDIEHAENFYRDEGGNYIERDGDVSMNLYDLTETHKNCTVEIWKNSVTGEVSTGWYENADE